MHAGIVVIGGNIMGAMVASELARRADPLRGPVVLLEEGGFEERAPATATIVESPGGALRAALVDGARALVNFEVHTGRGIGFGRPGLVDVRTGEDELPKGADPRRVARLLEVEAVEAGHFDPERALFDPVRLHTEVLALARTRGVVTRAGTRVVACAERDDAGGAGEGGLVSDTELSPNGGGVCGTVLTERHGEREEWTCEQVVVTCPDVAARLFPRLAAALGTEVRVERAYPSPRFTDDFVPLGTIRGSVGDLHDIASGAGVGVAHGAPDPLQSFFGGEDRIEYPHPAIRAHDFDVYPDPLAGRVVVAPREGELDRAALARFSPLFAELEEAAVERRVRLARPVDDLPLVGELAPRVFVAVGLGRRAAQLAAGLAPSLAALLQGVPVTAFDEAALRPTRYA